MFTLISNSPLSNVLAPPISCLEEFIFQCDSFSMFFKENNKTRPCKTNIDSTNLPTRLIKMADIVVTEQLEMLKIKKDLSYLCPTMEYLLESNLLETLSIVAQTDTPNGICPHILLFVIRVLSDSKVTLIPHKSVHTALNRLIIVCGRIPASPYECTEMYFLTSLIKLIYKNPNYINFFTNNSFPLINSLLSLLYSEDSEISKQSGDSIIKLLQIIDENTAKIIVNETPFCCKIVNQIITHFSAIPHSLKLEEIEASNKLLDGSYPISIRKYLCFLKWFIFFDMLINTLPDNSILTINLLNEFRLNFLESCLRSDLRGDGYVNELDAIDSLLFSTMITSNCLRNTESIKLFDTISHFLLISDNENELINKCNHKNLNSFLLKRCQILTILNGNDKNDEELKKWIKLSSATLQLFEDILSKPSYEIVYNLIIKELINRNYLNNDKNGEHYEKENISTTGLSSKFNSLTVLDQMHAIANEINESKINFSSLSYLDINHLNQILHLFISLIPDELKFDLQLERAEYEAYLMEAAKGFHIFMINCYSKWNITDLDTNDQSNANDLVNEKESFIEIIFDNLNSLMKLPYEIKLQVIKNIIFKEFKKNYSFCLLDFFHFGQIIFNTQCIYQ